VLMELEAEGMERVEGEPFVLTGVSEATDSRGGVHTGVRLEMPRLTRAPQKLVTEVYPNPTNGPVSIRLNLPEAGRVEVVITDASGQQVAEPVQLNFTAGASTFPMSLEQLSSGVYMLNIQYFDNKKLVVHRHKVVIAH